MALGIEGDRVRARHVLGPGEAIYCSLSWAEDLASPDDVDDAEARLAATTRFWRAWLGTARIPDHRWRDPLQRSALAIKGLTYMPTGATVAALTTSLPETPGGERNWDYRYTWMRDTTFTLQALHWLEPRLGGRRVHAVRRRPRAERGRLAADHVRHRRPARPDRVDARRPLRLRGRAPGADRQRRVRPAAERRLRRRARLDPAPHPPERSGCRDGSGRSSQSQAECATRVVARARPGHLGGPRRATALRLVEADVLGGARPRRQAGGDPRRPGAERHLARDRGGDPGGHPRARRAATTASCGSTTRPTRSTPRCSLAAIFGFLPAERRAPARRPCSRSRTT